MQMNQATVLAILAFTTGTLAQWDSYSYGNSIYARDAEPEYEEYEIYAREAEPEYEEEEFSHLAARDEAYLQGYYHGLARRQTKTVDPVLKKMADADTKDAAKLTKDSDDQKHKSEHDRESARLAKLNVADDQASITALTNKLKELEAKMKTDKETFRQKRKKAHEEAKKAKELKAKADAKTTEAKALTTRELLEEYFGTEFDF